MQLVVILNAISWLALLRGSMCIEHDVVGAVGAEAGLASVW